MSVITWLVSIADSIAATVLGFVLWVIMLWTFTMASIFQDENGQHLYCETSDSGVELCEKREWSLVT